MAPYRRVGIKSVFAVPLSSRGSVFISLDIVLLQSTCKYFCELVGRSLDTVSFIRKGKTAVARMGEGRGVYRVLVGKPEGKRPLGRPRRRWEDNIRMDLQEVGLGYENWIGLAQDRDRWRALLSVVRNFRVP